ncbi:MAG: lipoate--protein ligase [Streptococcaceae bacterium]|jgi:lipoate-protein ligase A|nr:lipoate--protein ligase [Streptococcaceae bacterium]
MRYLINKSTNPYFNLALDEYAMRYLDVGEDYFFLWQNEPSIIIGKNQNTLAEINADFIEQNQIKVARRMSGGGAVYHDFGNLNFTIITNIEDVSKVNFHKYVQPVIDALKSMGVNAVASGRNDILINEKKISGNAQRQANGRLMHHGTLMFDVDVDTMVRSLNVADDKFISKAAKSVASRVSNVKDALPVGNTLDDFWSKLHYYLSNEEKDKEITLTHEQLNEVQALADIKYSTWDWIYGKTPEFTYQNGARFAGGKIEVSVVVDNGYIEMIRFNGDYLGVNDVEEIEEALKGQRFIKEDVEKIFNKYPFASYFGTITQEEVLSILFN